jgi:HAD superfamily hydrolase (TIGR01450 family)
VTSAGLVGAYDIVIFDLDGVVYLGREPIDGAVEAIDGLYRAGVPVAYATNNASRRADEVAALLNSLGVRARAGEIVTSAQAAASLMAARLPAGAPVYVVGGPALVAEVVDVGLTVVPDGDGKPAAVVQGYAPDVGWSQLAEASVAVRSGAWWVATNADRTLPSPRGPLPGNGSLVAALAHALDRQPDVIVGKPAPALFRQAAAKVSAGRPLVIGDRLDTDIEGAVNAGMDSLLVLTGVSRPEDVLTAPAGMRPTWLAADLGALGDAGRAARIPDSDGDTATAAGWTATRTDAGLELDGQGAEVAALAALAALAWARPSVDPPRVLAADAAAATVLRHLSLAG